MSPSTQCLSTLECYLKVREEPDRNSQLGAMHVAAFEVPRRVVLIPLGGDEPLVAVIKAVQLGISVGVTVAHGGGP